MSALRGRNDRTGGEWAEAQDAFRESCEVQDRQAVRVVAAQANGVDDCRELLAMLGLKVPGEN